MGMGMCMCMCMGMGMCMGTCMGMRVSACAASGAVALAHVAHEVALEEGERLEKGRVAQQWEALARQVVERLLSRHQPRDVRAQPHLLARRGGAQGSGKYIGVR